MSKSQPRKRPLAARATATVIRAGNSLEQLLYAVDDMITAITKNHGMAERAGGLNDDEVDKLCRVRRLMVKVAREGGLRLS